MHTCKICSRKFRQLGRHLINTHSVNIVDYITTPSERIQFVEIQNDLKQSYRERSPFCVEFYEKKGISAEDGLKARQEIKRIHSLQKLFPTDINFYLNKGFDRETSELKIKEYKEKIAKVPQLNDLITKWGLIEGTRRFTAYKTKLSNREKVYLDKFSDRREGLAMICLSKGFGLTNTCDLDYTDWENYNKYCRTLTYMALSVYRYIIDPDGTKTSRMYGKNGYSIDHKFSVYGGFVKRVDPFKICSLGNLELITTIENSRKGSFCSITLDEVNDMKTILDEEWLSENSRKKIDRVYRSNVKG